MIAVYAVSAIAASLVVSYVYICHSFISKDHTDTWCTPRPHDTKVSEESSATSLRSQHAH